MTEAQTNAERQRGHRARMALLGYTEVRGIYLPPELHKALRDSARKLHDDAAAADHSQSRRTPYRDADGRPIYEGSLVTHGVYGSGLVYYVPQPCKRPAAAYWGVLFDNDKVALEPITDHVRVTLEPKPGAKKNRGAK